jgi:hypothetical protein
MSLEANGGPKSPATEAAAKRLDISNLLPEEVADLDGFPRHVVVVYRPGGGHTHCYVALRAASLAVTLASRAGVAAIPIICELTPIIADLGLDGEQ